MRREPYITLEEIEAFRKKIEIGQTVAIDGGDKRKLPVYILTNYNSTHKEDLERIYILREMGYWPYVMIYGKEKLPKGHITRRMQRWVNRRKIFEITPRFEDYIG